jgi:peptide/nickel transport system substrate-binding protein
LQRLISDEGGTIIPAFSNYADGKAKKVKGLQKIPICAFGGQEWPEFAWLDV